MFGVFRKNKIVNITSPISGVAVDLKEVNDPVFSERMLGEGVAIKPSNGILVAPCDGKLVRMFPTNYAIEMEIGENINILIHIGIDTVELKGEGFTRLIKEGTFVKKGTPIIEVDLEKLKEHRKNDIVPIVVTNMYNTKVFDYKLGKVVAGETIIMKVKNSD